MSVKDTRYYRRCPICGINLVGTDDGLEVFTSLVDQMLDPSLDNEDPSCTLCGEECTRSQAAAIIGLGEPPLIRR